MFSEQLHDHPSQSATFHASPSRPAPTRSSYAAGSPRVPPISSSEQPAASSPLSSPSNSHSCTSVESSEMVNNQGQTRFPPPSTQRERAYSDERHTPAPAYATYPQSLHSSPSYGSGLRVPVESPPKAAYLEKSSPVFGPSSPRAMQFGDAPRSPMFEGAGENEMDWHRFSMRVHAEQEEVKGSTGADKGSEWLDSNKQSGRRYRTCGWIGTLVVLCLLGGLLAWHFLTTKPGNTQPSTPNLGGLNGGYASTFEASLASSLSLADASRPSATGLASVAPTIALDAPATTAAPVVVPAAKSRQPAPTPTPVALTTTAKGKGGRASTAPTVVRRSVAWHRRRYEW